MACPSHMGHQAAAITSGAMQLEPGRTPPLVNCPCAAHPGTELLTPDYVGDHYYCDTATYYGHPQLEWYTNNTLWDGKDCYPGSKCCDNERLPWFWRTMPQETSDDVEVRWCVSNSGDIGYDKVSTELLEVFVH